MLHAPYYPSLYATCSQWLHNHCNNSFKRSTYVANSCAIYSPCWQLPKCWTHISLKIKRRKRRRSFQVQSPGSNFPQRWNKCRVLPVDSVWSVSWCCVYRFVQEGNALLSIALHRYVVFWFLVLRALFVFWCTKTFCLRQKCVSWNWAENWPNFCNYF